MVVVEAAAVIVVVVVNYNKNCNLNTTSLLTRHGDIHKHFYEPLALK
jgi:hypothetical protein